MSLSYEGKRNVASHGSDIEEKFVLKRDEHMNCIYDKVGEENIDEYVNSFKNGCSLKAILDRCSLMPAREKIAYLQQTEQGFSADMSAMPKDGTEAQIMLAKLKAEHPDIVERIKKGESFDKILVDMIPSSDPAPASAEPAENKESEVIA